MWPGAGTDERSGLRESEAGLWAAAVLCMRSPDFPLPAAHLVQEDTPSTSSCFKLVSLIACAHLHSNSTRRPLAVASRRNGPGAELSSCRQRRGHRLLTGAHARPCLPGLPGQQAQPCSVQVNRRFERLPSLLSCCRCRCPSPWRPAGPRCGSWAAWAAQAAVVAAATAPAAQPPPPSAARHSQMLRCQTRPAAAAASAVTTCCGTLWEGARPSLCRLATGEMLPAAASNRGQN